MRTLKFRAWDKKAKSMIDSTVNVRGEYDEYWGDARAIELGGIEDINKNPDYEVMQFTGLLDKNDKEIYEGDIVKQTYTFKNAWGVQTPYESEFPIEWDEELLRFNHPYEFNFSAGIDGEVEIIGNVWENPELLTQSTQ